MNSIQYLVSTLLSLYMFILMLRMWFQYCRVDFYNPISQSLVKLTNPVLNPLRKTVPTVKNIDLAALLFVFILGFIKLPLLYILGGTWTAELVSQNWSICSVWSALLAKWCCILFSSALFSVGLIVAMMRWVICFINWANRCYHRSEDFYRKPV